MKALVLSLSLVTLLSACTMPGANNTTSTGTTIESTGSVETSTATVMPVETSTDTDAMMMATGATESTDSTATGA